MVETITGRAEPVLSGQAPVHKRSSLWAEAEGATQPSKPTGSPTDGSDGIEHPMAQIGDATFLQQSAEAAEVCERSEPVLRVDFCKALPDHGKGVSKPPEFPQRQLIGCITRGQCLGRSPTSYLLVDRKSSREILTNLRRGPTSAREGWGDTCPRLERCRS